MDNQFEQTRKYWGSELSRGNLIYPNNQVIRFVKRNFKANRDITILDFGCGAGRNTIALFNEGFNVIAMDYTDTAIEMTREKLKRIGISDSAIIKNKGFEIPLDCNSIDAVIADGSLFYYPKKDITKILSNLFAVMKPEALLWCDFRTKQDSLFARGIPLSDGLFR